MKTNTPSRRSFLRALALASASVPLLRFSEASASPAVAPLRLILLWSPFQVTEPFYHPQVSSTNSALAPQGTNFYLSFPNSILAPLAPFQSDLIIFRGLTYGQAINSHSSGASVFTGAQAVTSPNSDPTTMGSSIENYLFNRMAQQGSLSPFLAGFFAYIFSDHCYDSDISFNAGNPVAMIGNPLNLYNDLFSNFTAPSSQAVPQATINTANRRQQTLGLVQKYLKNYQNLLVSTAPSYSVLQSHLSAAQGLGAQVAASVASSGVTCTPPTASSVMNDTNPDDGSLVAADAPKDMASFIQVMTQAFACDITRFGALKMSASEDPSQALINEMPGLTNWDQNTNWHAEVTHGTTGEASNPLDVQMAQFKTYYMTQVASLLTALKGVSDPYNPAQTLYDNTVVLIGSEGPIQSVGTDVHGNGTNDQALLLAGGCGGYFKGGQLLLAGGSKQPTVNHNALLTNIINAFENNQQQFNPAYVPKILTQYGDFPFSVSPTSWLT
jgi:hypothetical protein